MHICVSKLNIIGSDNGLPPGQRQAIIWINDGIWPIGPLGTNFSDILSKVYTFLFTKMYLKMSSGKWQPFCLELNVLTWLMLLCNGACRRDCRSDALCLGRVTVCPFPGSNTCEFHSLVSDLRVGYGAFDARCKGGLDVPHCNRYRIVFFFFRK